MFITKPSGESDTQPFTSFEIWPIFAVRSLSLFKFQAIVLPVIVISQVQIDIFASFGDIFVIFVG